MLEICYGRVLEEEGARGIEGGILLRNTCVVATQVTHSILFRRVVVIMTGFTNAVNVRTGNFRYKKYRDI